MKPTCLLVIFALFAVACEEKPAATTPTPAKPASPQAALPVPKPQPPVAPAASGATSPVAPAATGTVSVLGLSFAVPEGWKSVPPANSMRLAEFQVGADPAKACSVAFSTAGGDVQSNIDRWAGQVRDAAGQPSKPATSVRTVGGMQVHSAEMTGSFSAGMGDTTAHENWMLRGSIIETPGGMLFIKMTGPAEAMTAAGPAFNAMIDGLKKP